jgi:hypothetical protein
MTIYAAARPTDDPKHSAVAIDCDRKPAPGDVIAFYWRWPGDANEERVPDLREVLKVTTRAIHVRGEEEAQQVLRILPHQGRVGGVVENPAAVPGYLEQRFAGGIMQCNVREYRPKGDREILTLYRSDTRTQLAWS